MRLHPGSLATAQHAVNRTLGESRFQRVESAEVQGEFGPKREWNLAGDPFRGRFRHLKEEERVQYQVQGGKRVLRLSCAKSVELNQSDRVRDLVRSKDYEIIALVHDPEAMDRLNSIYILSEGP